MSLPGEIERLCLITMSSYRSAISLTILAWKVLYQPDSIVRGPLTISAWQAVADMGSTWGCRRSLHQHHAPV